MVRPAKTLSRQLGVAVGEGDGVVDAESVIAAVGDGRGGPVPEGPQAEHNRMIRRSSTCRDWRNIADTTPADLLSLSMRAVPIVVKVYGTTGADRFRTQRGG